MEFRPINPGLRVNENTYLRDPEGSALGTRIISESINVIDELGFEDFTFRKLGQHIGSPESSVYRYFENKHKLLIYLMSWYWCWLEYKLAFAVANITSPEERLRRAIDVLTRDIEEDESFIHINEVKLNRIVINESAKVYLTREVDEENKLGLFGVYKQLVDRLSQIVLEIDPKFKYPHSLISTIIEGAHQQKYFREHLPSLTDFGKNQNDITEFYLALAFSMLDKKH